MVWESDKKLSWYIGRRPLLDIAIDRDPPHIKSISDFFNGLVIFHVHFIRHFFFIGLVNEWPTAVPTPGTGSSKAENNFFRFKTIIGRKLASRHPKNQDIEANLGCLILNKMALCGMPEYEKR